MSLTRFIEAGNGNGLAFHFGKHQFPFIKVDKRLNIVLHHFNITVHTIDFAIVTIVFINTPGNEFGIQSNLCLRLPVIRNLQGVTNLGKTKHRSNIDTVGTKLPNRRNRGHNKLGLLWSFGHMRANAINKLIPWVLFMAVNVEITNIALVLNNPVDRRSKFAQNKALARAGPTSYDISRRGGIIQYQNWVLSNPLASLENVQPSH